MQQARRVWNIIACNDSLKYFCCCCCCCCLLLLLLSLDTYVYPQWIVDQMHRCKCVSETKLTSAGAIITKSTCQEQVSYLNTQIQTRNPEALEIYVLVKDKINKQIIPIFRVLNARAT